jgi:hypothetical protein
MALTSALLVSVVSRDVAGGLEFSISLATSCSSTETQILRIDKYVHKMQKKKKVKLLFINACSMVQ